MTEIETQNSALNQLLDRMTEAKQLSSSDAENLRAEMRKTGQPQVQTEEDVLRWLAKEYDLAYTSLEDVQPDRELLSLFPARLLLKDELLPLRRVNGCVILRSAGPQEIDSILASCTSCLTEATCYT